MCRKSGVPDLPTGVCIDEAARVAMTPTLEAAVHQTSRAAVHVAARVPLWHDLHWTVWGSVWGSVEKEILHES